jgi:hypothetical protein
MHDESSSPPASLSKVAPAADHGRPGRLRPRRVLYGAALTAALVAAVSSNTAAFTITIAAAAPKTIYLQVGVGSFTANYNANGQPQNNPIIDVVSTSVAAAAVGNGTAQAMTADTATTNSFYDGFLFCKAPLPAGSLYIGGFYRTTGAATAAAQVTATVPAALANAAGSTIPFSKISWASGGTPNPDTPPAEPFPSGTFVSGGVQNVGSMASNTWNESCLSFSYLNNSVPAAGTFTGRVIYTMSSP